eukprot:TRINITY_DN2594_c0_g1_i1.p1 TRINITY_DN2594_c0_g1~~TRINITY_DN2594_c0_g1_i1.p1  ORF type:complete len:1500 (+),score=432.19 TRINITY_DN2594_c0_g1_i1:106-4605(+)
MPDSILGLPERSESELQQLNQKNALLDVLDSSAGQQIVVVGDTSVGKSSMINFMLGYPINFESAQIGTRRPCIISQVCDPEREDVVFEVKFCKSGDKKEFVTPAMGSIKDFNAQVNDPSFEDGKYFPCLKAKPELNQPPSYPGAFDDEPVYVQMRHKDFRDGLRLIDLPGLTRRHAMPMEIARKFIQPNNIVILILGRDNRENAGWVDLVELMTQCSQVIFIQNFAGDQMRSGMVPDNYRFIKNKMAEKNPQLASKVKLYCMDIGRPKTQQNVDQGLWKEGEDQEDWLAFPDVHDRMWQYAKKMGDKLYADYPKVLAMDGIEAGLGPILCQLSEFQFADMTVQLAKLKTQVADIIAYNEKKLLKLHQDLADLNDPAEWQSVLSSTAKTVTDYLDTTIALPTDEETRELGDVDRELRAALATTNQEVESFSQACWHSEEIDKKIREVLAQTTSFELDTKMCCLRSWFRLLDEFTAMLVFSPMELINETTMRDAFNRIGTGSYTTTQNKFDQLVSLVCGVCKPTEIIRRLLTHFKDRMLYLMSRDIKKAMLIVREDHEEVIGEFLRKVELDASKNSADRKNLCDKIEEALLQHANQCMEEVIEGRQKELNGDVYVEEGSGLKVRTDENTMHAGELHWLLPFKPFLLNGQIPWKDLRLDPSQVPAGMTQRPVEEVDEETPEGGALDALLGEINPDEKTTNAMNFVNLKMYKYTTTQCDITLQTNANRVMYNLEVMKLLKAMQAEVSNFWASKRSRFIQSVKAAGGDFQEKLKSYAESKIKKDWAEDPMANRQPANYMDEVILPALDDFRRGTEHYFDKEKYPENNDRRKTFDEIKDSGRPLWPGFASLEQYSSYMAAQVTDMNDGGIEDQFPSSMNEPMLLDRAWKRLTEEFIYVLQQLNMRPVTDSELAMARASSGSTVQANPEEITQKLALHRIQMLGQSAGDVFRKRFMYLFKRDANRGLERTVQRHQSGQSGPSRRTVDITAVNIQGKPLQTWMSEMYEQFALEKVNELLQSLEEKFLELVPFEFTLLNGRLPLATIPMQQRHYSLQSQPGAANSQFSVLRTDIAPEDLAQLWTMPLRASWPEIANALFVLDSDKGLHLSPEANSKACNVLQDLGSSLLTNMINVSGDNDRPANGYCCWSFQLTALRVYKAMFVNAVEECRPKLKKKMAEVYQEISLRRVLQNSLKYKGVYDGVRGDKDRELVELKARQGMLMEALRRVETNQLSSAVTVDDKEHLRVMELKAEKAAEKETRRRAMLAALGWKNKVQGRKKDEVKTQFDLLRSSLDRYFALDEMTEDKLIKIDCIELRDFQHPKERVFYHGYIFRQTGWDGKEVEFVKPPDQVLPHMRLFETKGIDVMCGFRATDKDLNPQLVNDTYKPYATFEIPKLWPLQEYWLGIQTVMIGKSQPTELFDVCIPLAYVLKENDKALFEKVGQFSIDAREPVPFDMRASGPNQVKFSFQERQGHYEDYSNKVKNFIANTTLEVTFSIWPRATGVTM